MSKRFSLYTGALVTTFFIFLSSFIVTGCINRESSIDVQILSVNDFHGHIDRSQELKFKGKNLKTGTAPIMASHLNKLKSKNPKNTLLVHAGDIINGSPPVSALLQDEPTLEVFNALDFDKIGTLGNHEFDEGTTELYRLLKGGKHPKTGDFEGINYPYISANVIDKKTRKTILEPTLMKEISGVKIGFIGITTTETTQLVLPEGIHEIEFLDEADTINKYADELTKQGANTIMVLIHEGGQQNWKTGEIKGPIADIARKINDKVSVIISGHSHSILNGVVNGKLIVQAYKYGAAIADVDVKFDAKTKKIISKSAEIVPTVHNVVGDPKIKNIVKTAQKRVGPIIEEKIAKIKYNIFKKANVHGESALGNLITDGQRWEMRTDFAILNSGGIRADLEAGDATYGDLYSIQPFGNELLKVEMTGSQLRQVLNQQYTADNFLKNLQVSGLRYTYNPNRPASDRVIGLYKKNGSPIKMNEKYSVTINKFLSSGGDGFTIFKNIPVIATGPTDIEVLISYIKHLPQPISYYIEGRVTRN